MKTYFEHLPTEMLEEILKYIPQYKDLMTLKNIPHFERVFEQPHFLINQFRTRFSDLNLEHFDPAIIKSESSYVKLYMARQHAKNMLSRNPMNVTFTKINTDNYNMLIIYQNTNNIPIFRNDHHDQIYKMWSYIPTGTYYEIFKNNPEKIYAKEISPNKVISMLTYMFYNNIKTGGYFD